MHTIISVPNLCIYYLLKRYTTFKYCTTQKVNIPRKLPQHIVYMDELAACQEYQLINPAISKLSPSIASTLFPAKINKNNNFKSRSRKLEKQ